MNTFSNSTKRLVRVLSQLTLILLCGSANLWAANWGRGSIVVLPGNGSDFDTENTRGTGVDMPEALFVEGFAVIVLPMGPSDELEDDTGQDQEDDPHGKRASTRIPDNRDQGDDPHGMRSPRGAILVGMADIATEVDEYGDTRLYLEALVASSMRAGDFEDPVTAPVTVIVVLAPR